MDTSSPIGPATVAWVSPLKLLSMGGVKVGGGRGAAVVGTAGKTRLNINEIAHKRLRNGKERDLLDIVSSWGIVSPFDDNILL